MKIILLGYMASGKSTLGRLLAEKLNTSFIDLDDYIEEKEGKSVSDIFKNKGEIYFRRKENQYLKALLLEENDFVLSLGGGTPCYFENMKFVNEADKTLSFYLNTSIKEIVIRIEKETNKRPLVAHLNTKDELQEFIGKHLFERSYYYNQAQHIINNNKSLEISADSILDIIAQDKQKSY